MRYAGIELNVRQEDALIYHTDLLVLKYAQASYGVDLAALQASQIDVSRLPPVGSSLLIQDPPGIVASNILFIGTESLYTFDYEAVRRFSRTALSMAAKLRPSVREVSMTLHGPGFGLDEIEAFESEIAGVVEAIDSSNHPVSLRAVTFVERDERRARRMRECLDLLIAKSPWQNSVKSPRRVDSVGYDSAAKPHAFVAMPFESSFNDILYFGISPSIRSVGLLCERMDSTPFTGDVLNRMKERISSAKLVVADLSGANPNVYLEVGYAWGREVPCVLLCNREADLKFDVQGHRCLFYGSIMELEKKLTEELKNLY